MDRAKMAMAAPAAPTLSANAPSNAPSALSGFVAGKEEAKNIDGRMLDTSAPAYSTSHYKKATGARSSPASSPAMNAGSAGGGLSPQNAQMLAQSVSRLMQSTKQMSELTQSANESSVRNFGAARAELRTERTISTQPGGPLIQEFNADKAGAAGNSFNNARDMATNMGATVATRGSESEQQPLMVPESPSSYKIMRNQLMALLPPSVVGGIPLARLGASERELAQTFNNKNIASKQVIDDWSVWTIKGSSPQTPAVQLYLRRSIVEAIRVFQPSYLGPEIGIKIGDNLKSIKDKFGDPAFILDEPGSHTYSSKNYVYPISHVAFQLARSRTQPRPEVLSVLIFEVQ
jgi:hypothetical protein